MDSDTLKNFIRKELDHYLDDPNITSVGIGHKIVEGKDSGKLCLSFSVAMKRKSRKALERLETKKIPEFFMVKGEKVLTDVIERTYELHAITPTTPADHQRKRRPIKPGTSLTRSPGGSGTFGGVVFCNGIPYVLSNWHVLDNNNPIGTACLQQSPGDGGAAADKVGELARSYLGTDGDCAIARITANRYSARILGLNVIPRRGRSPELGDKVVKSGRTTGVTHGIVDRAFVRLPVTYSRPSGANYKQRVESFDIKNDPALPAPGGEISLPGDSGSLWMKKNSDGTVSTTCVGLHFAGSAASGGSDSASACFITSVLDRLNVSFNVSYSHPLEFLPEMLASAGRGIF